MKKIILSAIVAVCAISANAQTWAGGSLGFNVTDFDGASETQMDLTLAPEIGYTLNDNWEVAAALKFGIAIAARMLTKPMERTKETANPTKKPKNQVDQEKFFLFVSLE